MAKKRPQDDWTTAEEVLFHIALASPLALLSQSVRKTWLRSALPAAFGMATVYPWARVPLRKAVEAYRQGKPEWKEYAAKGALPLAMMGGIYGAIGHYGLKPLSPSEAKPPWKVPEVPRVQISKNPAEDYVNSPQFREKVQRMVDSMVESYKKKKASLNLAVISYYNLRLADGV